MDSDLDLDCNNILLLHSHMNRRERRHAVEVLRDQFKKTGEYKNWRSFSQSHDNDLLEFPSPKIIIGDRPAKVKHDLDLYLKICVSS